MTQDRQVLELAGHAGQILLENGAEIYRVQETMTHILDAFHIGEFNVYVISNGIFATVNEHRDDALSLVRHVPLGSVNLSRIDAVNDISRRICEGRLGAEEAERELLEAERLTPERPVMHVLACGLGAAGFCCLFGGSLLDGVAAFPIGMVLQLYLFASARRNAHFMPFIWGSLLVTVLSGAASMLSGCLDFGRVVIGGIIPLVPGVSFTTSIREFFNGDYLSGVIHMISALLTAMCIALGVCGGVALVRLMGGAV